ncbi:unnamed protein product [marine sediment metagenome]|uniref:Uncharacterized protein n=1 Tax=marine sediment metagenome TaxID=412755 RepID=X1N0D3_9ZZZZ
MQFTDVDTRDKVGFFESCEFVDQHSYKRIKRLFGRNKASHKRYKAKRRRKKNRSL